MRKRARELGLSGLVEQVERWRRERRHLGAAVPVELWEAAVQVARREGVHATARAIRFDSSRLKARMARVEESGLGSPGATQAAPVAFIEIERPSLGVAGPSGETVVELVGRLGERMRIVGAPGTIDVAGLVQAFWSRAS